MQCAVSLLSSVSCSAKHAPAFRAFPRHALRALCGLPCRCNRLPHGLLCSLHDCLAHRFCRGASLLGGIAHSVADAFDAGSARGPDTAAAGRVLLVARLLVERARRRPRICIRSLAATCLGWQRFWHPLPLVQLRRGACRDRNKQSQCRQGRGGATFVCQQALCTC